MRGLVQCFRVTAHRTGNGVVERGVRPRVEDDGWEERVRAVRWIGGPGAMSEHATVERFQVGVDGEIFVKWAKAVTPQLRTYSRLPWVDKQRSS